MHLFDVLEKYPELQDVAGSCGVSMIMPGSEFPMRYDEKGWSYLGGLGETWYPIGRKSVGNLLVRGVQVRSSRLRRKPTLLLDVYRP